MIVATITDIKRKILELPPANFQEFCDAFLSKKVNGLIHEYGMQPGTGNTTKGNPDTYFRKSNGKYILVVYTIQQTNIYNKIKEDIEKCFDEDKTKLNNDAIEEIICCHTSANLSSGDDQRLYNYCQERNVKLTIYGIDEISLDVYNNYHFLAKNYLGLDIDTGQIMGIEEFVSMYDANKMAAPLNTIFQFRDNEKTVLKQAVLSSSAVVITGKAGVGKTRLVLEIMKEFEHEEKYKILCIKNNNLPIYDDLVCHLEEKGKYILFVDDANELIGLNHVINYVIKDNNDFEVKVVVTVRDYVKIDVEKTILKYVQPKIINIEVLNKNQIAEFLKTNFNIHNEKYISQIMKISKGNLRIAYMAGKVVLKNNSFKSIMDVTQLYELYYAPYIDDVFSKDDKLCYITGFLAIVRGLYLGEKELYFDVLNEMNISFNELKYYVNKLSSMEFVELKKEKVVLFSDQSLANYMVYYTFFQRKICPFSTILKLCFNHYENSMVEVVNVILNLFNNNQNVKYCTNEILKVWKGFSKNKNAYFKEFVQKFHIFNPVETFIYINEILDQLDSKTIQKEYYMNYQWILECLTGYNDNDYIQEIIELLIKYCSKTDELFDQGCEWLTCTYGINENVINNQYEIINAISESLMNHLNEEITSHIFLKWIDKVLRLNFRFNSIVEDNTWKIYDGYIHFNDGLSNYRKFCWKGVIELSLKKEYKDNVITFLNSYTNDLEEELDNDVFENDFKFIKQIIDNLMCDDLLFLICVKKVQIFCKGNGFEYDEKWDTIFNGNAWKLYELLEDDPIHPLLDYNENRIDKIQKNLNHMNSKEIHEFIIITNNFMKSNIEETQKYSINIGIEITINSYRNDKERLLVFLENIIIYGTKLKVNPYHLFTFLYHFITPSYIYNFIKRNNFNQKNEWQYIFFETLPKKLVTKEIYNELKGYFKNYYNENIYSYRSLKILDNFLEIDENIYPNISEVIMNSNNINYQKCYLTNLFSDYCYTPENLLKLFDKNKNLLYNIYFCLLKDNQNYLIDRNGNFLLTFLKCDESNLLRFSKLFWDDERKTNDFEYHIIETMWKDNEYEKYFDCILEFFPTKKYYINKAFENIFHNYDDSELNQRQEKILLKFVKKYINTEEIYFIFECINALNDNLRKKTILLIISLNIDYDVFDKLHLAAGSYSGEGSLVPAYQKEINFLESLIPYLNGINYIRYKKRIKNLIDELMYSIEQEEIMNILFSL